MNGNIECASSAAWVKTWNGTSRPPAPALARQGWLLCTESDLLRSTPVIECGDGIAPDKKQVIGRNASKGSS
jgi:hypothetical protein